MKPLTAANSLTWPVITKKLKKREKQLNIHTIQCKTAGCAERNRLKQLTNEAVPNLAVESPVAIKSCQSTVWLFVSYAHDWELLYSLMAKSFYVCQWTRTGTPAEHTLLPSHFKELISNFVRLLTVTLQNSISSFPPLSCHRLFIHGDALCWKGDRSQQWWGLHCSRNRDLTGTQIPRPSDSGGRTFWSNFTVSTRHLETVPYSRLTRALRDATDPRFCPPAAVGSTREGNEVRPLFHICPLIMRSYLWSH